MNKEATLTHKKWNEKFGRILYNESKPSGAEIHTEAEEISCILKRHINIQNMRLHPIGYKNLLLDNVLIHTHTHTHIVQDFCDGNALVMNPAQILLRVKWFFPVIPFSPSSSRDYFIAMSGFQVGRPKFDSRSKKYQDPSPQRIKRLWGTHSLQRKGCKWPGFEADRSLASSTEEEKNSGSVPHISPIRLHEVMFNLLSGI